MLYKLCEYKKYLIISLILIIFIFIFFIFNNKNEDAVVAREEKINKKEDNEVKDKCMVDVKGYVNNIGLYEVDCNKRIYDVIEIAGGLKENANTSVINLGKKIFDQMVLVIYSNEEVNNFIETKEKENIIDNKCVEKSVVGNDACIKKEDRVETRVIISESNGSNDSNNLISINTATKEELMTLPGVGESKAIAIIKYREENGLFKNIDDIKNVTGIGDKMFEKIKNSITV